LSVSAVFHPDASARQVRIWSPTTPTGPETWHDPSVTAIFTPGGPAPAELNGLALSPATPPQDAAGWARLVAAPETRPPPPTNAFQRTRGAGVVVEEPDGRVWLIEPTNHFAGYLCTFPKGSMERGYELAALAAKEAFEETGLLVEIGAWLLDSPRPSSIARYYRARRIGGTPAMMGWESQAVLLVPKQRVRSLLNRAVDHPIAHAF
jgi:hypothetical protein